MIFTFDFDFKMLFTWFSVLGAVSFAVALPASVYPVRPYVFLAPDLPKFVLQPTVKLQTPSTIQQIQPIVDAKWVNIVKKCI